MEVEDKGCAPDEGCLTVEHVHLSPTLAAQTITYDFHALQPLLAILPSLVAEWAEIEFGRVVLEFGKGGWGAGKSMDDAESKCQKRPS